MHILALVAVFVLVSCSDSGSDPELRGPGEQAWALVATEEVADECGLDPVLLAQADPEIDRAYAIVRFGKLCHEYYPEAAYPGGSDTPEVVFSATKTLAALLTGAAAYRTKDLERTDAKTGPLRDTDRVDYWLDSFSFNPDAQVGHVLGMVAHNDDLSAAELNFTYDTVGATQINRLNDVVAAAIAQDSALGADVNEFLNRYLFDPLGMQHSDWEGDEPNKNFAFGWTTTARDMARVGLLMLDRGVWNGERLVDDTWVQKMTHPSFESASNSYGYLTWMVSRSNGDYGDNAGKLTEPDAECTPASLWPENEYPHGLSNATDCNPLAPYGCGQNLDVGVWYAAGLGGNYIIGHRGLDMVLVVKSIGSNNQERVWNAIRPALVALDETYPGDEEAFCGTYAAGNYAPNLRN